MEKLLSFDIITRPVILIKQQHLKFWSRIFNSFQLLMTRQIFTWLLMLSAHRIIIKVRWEIEQIQTMKENYYEINLLVFCLTFLPHTNTITMNLMTSKLFILKLTENFCVGVQRHAFSPKTHNTAFFVCRYFKNFSLKVSANC